MTCHVHAYGYCQGKCETCNTQEVAEVVALTAETDIAKTCLTALGYGAVLETVPDEVEYVTSPLYCTILKTNVVIPCLLRSCPFWIDRKPSLNCLLCYYRDREGTEELSTREIAEVLDYTVTETNAYLDSGLVALRHMSIGLPVGSKDLQEVFEFLPSPDVCCVCERPTPEVRDDILKVNNTNLAYCSLVCRIRKNPTIIRLENKFHADIADILLWALANFVKVNAMEQALDMDSYAIQQLIHQFLGSEALAMFPGERLPEAVQPANLLFAFES